VTTLEWGVRYHCISEARASFVDMFYSAERRRTVHLIIPSFLVCTHCGWNLTPTESEAV
jgi:hypothetical protein